MHVQPVLIQIIVKQCLFSVSHAVLSFILYFYNALFLFCEDNDKRALHASKNITLVITDQREDESVIVLAEYSVSHWAGH